MSSEKAKLVANVHSEVLIFVLILMLLICCENKEDGN